MKKCIQDLFCRDCFLLVYLALNLSTAYEFKCPSANQWVLRASSSCGNAAGYICLFDENKNAFGEMCRNKPYINRPGYKFVFVLNLDLRKCESTRYQPFTFSTNGRSKCIFEKTFCNGEGQIIYKNGSTYADRHCRCDYTRSYDFITKPEHGCYCVPSMEDCSCYQKPCPLGYILSPDYQCINLTSWNSQFTCKLTLPYQSKDTNFPSHDNSLGYIVAAPERKVRIILSISVGLSIVFMLILVQMTLFCLPKIKSFKDSKQIVLRENNELKSLLAGEVIPQNVIDLHQDNKEKMMEQFNHFLETRASKAISERIKKEQWFIITGPFGCGKSSLAFHTALKLEDTLGFDFIIISNIDDLLKYASAVKRQIFLIDDAFGKYNVSKYDTTWWNLHGNSIIKLLTKNVNLRLIMTSRLNIYMSPNIQQLKVRFCLSNLIEIEIAWTLEEKQMIGRQYLQEDKLNNLSKDVVSLYSFFPMICKRFNSFSNENIVEYFTNPVDYIKADIGNFNQSSTDLFLLALAVLIVFDNDVNNDLFNNFNRTSDKIFTYIAKEMGYKKHLSKTLLYSSFMALIDSYVSKQESNFACLNVNLFDALAVCIGPRIIHSILRYGTTAFIIDKVQLKTLCQNYSKFTIIIPNSLYDIFFERMLSDMKTAKHNIFIGSQHLSAEFREKYTSYMKKHLKKENLKNDENASTVLHFVAAEGYADYVEYFIELDKQMVKELDHLGQTALHKTCVKGHLQVASLLLENGACINQSDNDSKTALDIACECGENEMVELLLSREASIRQKTTDFRSPFHVACNKGNFKVAEILLKYKAEVNQWDYKGYTPLHLACEKGSIEITTMLVAHKANIDMPDLKGETPLFFACSKGHFEVAEILLLNKANVKRFNLLQNTPISIACEKKQIEIIRLLLRYKADVNCENIALLTPLHVACRKNNIDIIVLLIKHGALVNKPDSNSQTPLFIACSIGYHIDMGKITKNSASVATIQNEETHVQEDDSEGNEEIVKVLLNAGANVNKGDTYGITPIHLACKAQREKIVKLLINAGVDVNRVDKNGTTSLDIAREGGQNEILSLMVNANVNVNKSDKHSMPPLHMACKEGNEATVKKLLGMGANVNEMDNDEMTPLHVACKSGQEEVVTLLINAGVNLNKSDTNGVTPLHIACKDGNEEIVKVLLNSVANMKMIDKDGKTPLDFARKRGHNDIVTLLLNAGTNGKTGDKNEITTLHMADKGEVTTSDLSIGNVDVDGNRGYENEITTLHMADECEREVITNDLSIGNVDVD